MSLRRSALTRLALATAVGALVTAAVATPATADDDWNGDGGDPGTSTWDEGGQGGGGGGGGGGWNTGSDTNTNSNSNSNSNSWQNQGSGQSGQWNQGGGQGGDGGDGGGQWNQGGGDGGGQWNQSGGDGGGQWNQGAGQGGDGQWNQSGHHDTQRLFRGRVTANTLLLRSKPTRASQVIRSVHRGEIVSIFCKTPGQSVDGNPLWYLLTDGTWAWGSARYIENIGEAPRWC
ncbi:SH3 domain-containing protein [Streptomyces griseoruber]|uniref:SH3 domain-containing protein n=1 Tax=Streptomyces griseoruber TaxID=1943 RepID=UPI0037BB3232